MNHHQATYANRTHTVTTKTLTLQQEAAALLGYTQVSWDNASGKEVQPETASKKWTDLTTIQKSSALVLGYNEKTWSTISKTKTTSWSALTTGSTGEEYVRHLVVALNFCMQVKLLNFCAGISLKYS